MQVELAGLEGLVKGPFPAYCGSITGSKVRMPAPLSAPLARVDADMTTQSRRKVSGPLPSMGVVTREGSVVKPGWSAE